MDWCNGSTQNNLLVEPSILNSINVGYLLNNYSNLNASQAWRRGSIPLSISIGYLQAWFIKSIGGSSPSFRSICEISWVGYSVKFVIWRSIFKVNFLKNIHIKDILEIQLARFSRGNPSPWSLEVNHSSPRSYMKVCV